MFRQRPRRPSSEQVRARRQSSDENRVLGRGVLLLQAIATGVVLGWVPGNAAKLLVMIAIWAGGFGGLSMAEGAAMAAVNLLFSAMDIGAIGKGTFRFEHPDLLGLPAYEFLMWGFYTLNALRLLGGAPPSGHMGVTLAAAAIFATPFMTIADPTMLGCAAGLGLAIAFLIFHEPLDFAYAAYMLAMGVLIEYIGTGTGEWIYPDAPYTGVPIWSAIMWAGIGLFTRRLLQPLIYRRSRPVALAR